MNQDSYESVHLLTNCVAFVWGRYVACSGCSLDRAAFLQPDSTGNFQTLIVAVFRVDSKTGSLAFTGHYMPVSNRSIVAFLGLAQTD